MLMFTKQEVNIQSYDRVSKVDRTGVRSIIGTFKEGHSAQKEEVKVSKIDSARYV